MRESIVVIFLSSILLFACKAENSESESGTESDTTSVETSEKFTLDSLNIPDGSTIQYFAKGIPGARSLRYMEEENIVFVGSRSEGNVYALPDKDLDGKADTMYTILSGLNSPNGVAIKDGDLYIAEIGRIIRINAIAEKLGTDIQYEVITDNYPNDDHHGWKYIDFGPDGYLYVPVGAPCNICNSTDEIYASITRLNVETGEIEIMQNGIRNTVGFTWHPTTEVLWFTDNGRDWMGDNKPFCELNRAPEKGMHFGYPFCHQGNLPDPKFGTEGVCKKYTPPVQNLGPHVAPLGMEFITSKRFPDRLQNSVLIAEHGSWNRSTPIGYRVTLVKLDGSEATEYTPFIDRKSVV